MTRVLWAILAIFVSRPTQAAEELRQAPPSGLVISYSTNAVDRPTFRREMLHETVAQLETWRRGGVIAHYRLLWSRYADNLNWDAMLILDFGPTGDIARWANIEADYPGGLAVAAAHVVKRIESAPIDMPRGKHDPASRSPVYLVVPYDYLVPLGDYMKYVDGYVVPQLDGWMAERALQGYDVAVARYGTARPWSSMLLLAYRGDAGLAQRDAVLARVRAHLDNDPRWKALAENKQHVRDERAPIVADILAER